MSQILIVIFLIAVVFAYRKDLKDYSKRYNDKTLKAFYVIFGSLAAIYLLYLVKNWFL
jgi:hypothetical protein